MYLLNDLQKSLRYEAATLFNIITLLMHILVHTVRYVHFYTITTTKRGPRLHLSSLHVPIPASERSKAWVCGSSLAGIVSSNLAMDMEVCLLCVTVVCCQVEVSAWG